MQNDINATIDRTQLGKGVFQPSRAPIASEMKARLQFGGQKQGTAKATSSRH